MGEEAGQPAVRFRPGADFDRQPGFAAAGLTDQPADRDGGWTVEPRFEPGQFRLAPDQGKLGDKAVEDLQQATRRAATPVVRDQGEMRQVADLDIEAASLRLNDDVAAAVHRRRLVHGIPAAPRLG